MLVKGATGSKRLPEPVLTRSPDFLWGHLATTSDSWTNIESAYSFECQVPNDIIPYNICSPTFSFVLIFHEFSCDSFIRIFRVAPSALGKSPLQNPTKREYSGDELDRWDLKTKHGARRQVIIDATGMKFPCALDTRVPNLVYTYLKICIANWNLN